MALPVGRPPGQLAEAERRRSPTVTDFRRDGAAGFQEWEGGETRQRSKEAENCGRLGAAISGATDPELLHLVNQ